MQVDAVLAVGIDQHLDGVRTRGHGLLPVDFQEDVLSAGVRPHARQIEERAITKALAQQLPAVEQSVAVAVRVRRIGAQPVLHLVTQAIIVAVVACIADQNGFEACGGVEILLVDS